MISIIVAIGKNNTLGFGNALPWHLPDDLKRFKKLTLGHAIIMGRRTYESIGKPLPDRKNIVITREKDFAAPGCIVAHSWEEAVRSAGDETEIFVVGGSQIYAMALPHTDKLYLTWVEAETDGDVFFPKLDLDEWRETYSESHPMDERHGYPSTFKIYERKKE